ncbi:MAG TPA: helix-hairpin-helix domain-containing protein, partial [Candidatus Eisenbacteria bacterium]|nr:helix-hairpin-helix domain-containing protein [Candidatus Eisenbacteria bacterium]
MRGWELFTPAERRLAVLLFALAVLGETARFGRRVSPGVALWLDGDTASVPVPADTIRVMPHPVDADSIAAPVLASSSDTPPDTTRGIDPNTANLTALMELPGVGPVLARRILEDRSAHGSYRRPEDLLRVPGIGPAKLAKLRPRLLISAWKSRGSRESPADSATSSQ